MSQAVLETRARLPFLTDSSITPDASETVRLYLVLEHGVSLDRNRGSHTEGRFTIDQSKSIPSLEAPAVSLLMYLLSSCTVIEAGQQAEQSSVHCLRLSYNELIEVSC